MKLPKEWKEVELGIIFEFQKKSKIKAGEGKSKGKYKFFTSSDKQTKFINEYTQDGEFLIFATGGHAGIHYCDEKFATSTDCFIVKVDDKVLAKYVYYFLFSKIQLLEEGFKGAGLKHISKGYIQNIKIAYPENKDIQKAIITTIEKAEKAKEWRKEADELTNNYLKSVFLEMFGDYLRNNESHKKIINFCPSEKSAIKAGPFGSSLKKEFYVDKGYKIYGQEQVIKNDFNYGDYYIDEERYKKLENCKIKSGDILISLVGSYGRISIVPEKFDPGIINPRLMKITLDKTKMNPTFFRSLFLSSFVKNKLKSVSHGGTMDIINVSLIKNINFPDVPIALQNKFASIVKEVESMKEHQKESKDQIDNLFNALMQKAFKGELVV